MNKIKFSSVLFIFIITTSFVIHKYYFSLTEINYNNTEKTIEIITSVFIDDFEKSLNTEFRIDAQLNTKDEKENIKNYFLKYLKKHLTLKINDNLMNFNYLGKEYDGDIMYIYLEIKKIESLKSVEIKNEILINEFNEQQNLIKIKANNIKKSLLLTQNENKGILYFE